MLVDDRTRQFRADLAEIARQSDDALARVWRGLDLTKVADVREALVDLAMALGSGYGEASALATAEYFDDLRVAAGVDSTFVATLVNNLDEAAIRSDMGWAVDPLTREDPSTALAKAGTVIGALLRDASNDTVRTNVQRDITSVGWYRIARANGCDFCVMLSQRGAVYREKTADFAAHGNCHCTAKPSWDPDAPEVDVRAYEASQRTSHLRALDEQDGGDRYENHKANIAGWLGDGSHLAAFRAELI